MRREPQQPDLLALSGQWRLLRGEVEAALAAFELAEERAQGSRLAEQVGRRFVMALAYLPDVTASDLCAAGASWERRYATPVARASGRGRATEGRGGRERRRMRVGYYSPDFRQHSIAHFVLPLLRNHDRAGFEIFLYADSPHADVVTAAIREQAEHWRELYALPELDAIACIAADELDLLIDLTGFFGTVRPRIFAAKPAWRQAHLLGYHGSTGLSSLDARFSDAVCDPPGREKEGSERVVRIEPGFHCFEPLCEPIEEGESPVVRTGVFTFGSFNNLAKVNPTVIAQWARVLAAAPRTRLLLKALQLHDAGLRAEVVARFAAHGVAGDRIEVLGGVAGQREHLELYRRVDLALDTFPCNGVTTICEALWMGVPTLTYLGARHSARVGASLLRQVGLEDFIAEDEDDYVRRAVGWAEAPGRLVQLRSRLRAQLLFSSLGDGAAYARRMEAAYVRLENESGADDAQTTSR
jgi:protein O-GlcNAc transferase